MADYYVRSTDGDDADSGATWALAKATIQGALAVAAAGDRVFVSQAHAQTQASALTLTSAGTATNPIQILCADDSAGPPTSLATTATVTTTGANSLTIAGSIYCYGIKFAAMTGFSAGALNVNSTAGHVQEYDHCALGMNSTSTSTLLIQFGAAALTTTPSLTLLRDTNLSYGHVNHRISVAHGSVVWKGGSLVGAATTTLAVFGSSGRGGILDVSGVDLSAADQFLNLSSFGTGAGASTLTLSNCKLPASWAGALGSYRPGCSVAMFNCDSGDTNYRFETLTPGTLTQDTAVYRTGGASDGTTPISWRMAAGGSGTKYPVLTIDTPKIAVWNETIGSAITATLEVVTDGVTLTDADCWIEVQYPGTSGSTKSTFVADVKASPLASAADQASSAAAWTTTGLASPVKQKLSVTFTPQEKGPVVAIVRLAKPSTTVYVDPDLVLA